MQIYEEVASVALHSLRSDLHREALNAKLSELGYKVRVVSSDLPIKAVNENGDPVPARAFRKHASLVLKLGVDDPGTGNPNTQWVTVATFPFKDLIRVPDMQEHVKATVDHTGYTILNTIPKSVFDPTGNEVRFRYVEFVGDDHGTFQVEKEISPD